MVLPNNYVWNTDDLGANNIRQAKEFPSLLQGKKLLTGADFNLYEPEGDLVRVQRTGGNIQYIRPLRGGDPYKKNLWTLIFGLSGQEAVTMNGDGVARAYGAAPFKNSGSKTPKPGHRR